MEIVNGLKYKHRKGDCPFIMTSALQQKYKEIPLLGCNVNDEIFDSKLNRGFKKYGMEKKQIYSSSKNNINEVEITKLLKHLIKNCKDGFFSLEHTDHRPLRHIIAFLYNKKYKTLDFFDSYNDTRTLFTLRLTNGKIKKFIEDFFSTYLKDEFLVEECFVFDHI